MDAAEKERCGERFANMSDCAAMLNVAVTVVYSPRDELMSTSLWAKTRKTLARSRRFDLKKKRISNLKYIVEKSAERATFNMVDPPLWGDSQFWTTFA